MEDEGGEVTFSKRKFKYAYTTLDQQIRLPETQKETLQGNVEIILSRTGHKRDERIRLHMILCLVIVNKIINHWVS